MQLRRMAEASLALAERRPDDLKAAVEKLGQQAPSNRQLFVLRLMGLISPAQGASMLMRIRGGLIILAMVVVLLAVGFGVATLLLLPFGGGSAFGAIALRRRHRDRRARRRWRSSANASRPRHARKRRAARAG